MGEPTPLRVVISPYQDSWPTRAGAELSILRDRLGPDAERLSHIGSTAIPGMAAKDLLDLQISVADLDRAERVFDPILTDAGFTRSPWRNDHVPVGRDAVEGDWAKRLWLRRSPGLDTINLHVRRSGSANERLALLFRDWFRLHPQAVPAYAAFKIALAAAVSDVETYSDIKDPVVDLVINTAEDWAAASGWRPHEVIAVRPLH